jgi:hypothetical protein
MLANTTDSNLIVDWSDRIAVEQVRSTFQYLVGVAALLRDFDCLVEQKGEVRNLHFYDKQTREQPFGFISSREWLLFTFRDPAVRSTAYSLSELQSVFSSARENSQGEWTVRIRTIEDVDKLISFIGWDTRVDIGQEVQPMFDG